MRQRLPNRRRQVTDRLIWPTDSGRAVTVSVGFDHAGRALEVFARLERPGSDLDQLLDDAGVLISRTLQHGDRLDDISRGLGRMDGVPTLLAALIAMARQIERDDAEGRP